MTDSHRHGGCTEVLFQLAFWGHYTRVTVHVFFIAQGIRFNMWLPSFSSSVAQTITVKSVYLCYYKDIYTPESAGGLVKVKQTCHLNRFHSMCEWWEQDRKSLEGDSFSPQRSDSLSLHIHSTAITNVHECFMLWMCDHTQKAGFTHVVEAFEPCFNVPSGVF